MIRFAASRLMRALAFSVFLLTIGLAAQSPQPAGGPVLFEGARLVNSDGTSPIESSAILVENGSFVRIGRRGQVALPRGGRRVDLSGKTVMPAMVDAHAHLGYMKGLSIGPENYTRENLVDHLQRHAYFGVAAGSTWGSDFGEMPYQVQRELIPNAARFVTLGRGLTTSREGTAENMRQNAYVIASEEDARQAARELAKQNVKMIKTWVQDRPAGIAKLSPALYRALIDEAHKQKLKVVVHATALEDVKDLLRAGVDGLAHLPNDVDPELTALLRTRPNVFFTPTLGTNRRTIYHPWLDPVEPLVADTVSPTQIKRLKERLDGTPADARERARQSWEKAASIFRSFIAQGVRLGLGSDAGGMSGDQFIGWTAHTEIENFVDAGMSPAQAIAACTKVSAEILDLQNVLGTISAGKSADFIVLDANPLDDVRNTRRISKVYLRGQQVDREGLKARWSRLTSN
jgi:imidazolonepropionase-like amidohydrolase